MYVLYEVWGEGERESSVTSLLYGSDTGFKHLELPSPPPKRKLLTVQFQTVIGSDINSEIKTTPINPISLIFAPTF